MLSGKLQPKENDTGQISALYLYRKVQDEQEKVIFTFIIFFFLLFL